MNLFPFENIVIDSPLTKSEIENAVKSNVAWNTELGMSFTKNSSREYEGFTDDGAFKIRRILKSGQNSFIPIVSGTISENGNNGSKVELKLRLHKLVMFIMTLFPVLIITNFLSSGSLMQPLLFGVFYLIAMYFYNYEADIVKDKVKSILKV